MSIQKESVHHVAKLAKLEFAADQVEHFTEQMSAIIDMVEQLKEVDTNEVPVTTHGYPLVNVMREDQAEEGTDRALLMRNVKTQEDGFIQVPAIMGNDEGGDA